MKKLIIKTVLVLHIAFFASCATTQQPKQKSNLTSGHVKKNIINGKTTQAEVLALLGSPNIITKNRDKKEVWTYSRQSFDTEASSFGGGIILIGGSKAFQSSSSSSFDLILTYNNDDIVENYSLISSQF